MRSEVRSRQGCRGPAVRPLLPSTPPKLHRRYGEALADPEGPAAVSFLTLRGNPQPSSSPRGMEEAPACPSTGSLLP